MVIVAGLGGEPVYASAFVEQAQATASAVEDLAAGVTLLVGEDAGRDGIRDAFAAHQETPPEDAVVVVLIGHGSYDGEHYRFNVPGPDPTADDLAEWLAPLPSERQLVVLATSASGAAVDVLKAERRAVIAATKDGNEANAVVFGRFWAAALTEPRADIDKDRRIDADEAFRFVDQAVARHYEDAQRIATEHPRSEGDIARFELATISGAGALVARAGSAAARREELLAEIDALRNAKGRHAEEEYFATLQELLLELSAVESELDER
ncbi:MAG: hypothetical protein OXH15_16755 [Gammaproteobacteria bacterium]|nr:hypothetical protein [Gammaproteobacteria bacterium]